MKWHINDSDVGYFWDEQWNPPSNEKRDKGTEAPSTTRAKEDDSKESR